jgi:hypothetical protein
MEQDKLPEALDPPIASPSADAPTGADLPVSADPPADEAPAPDAEGAAPTPDVSEPSTGKALIVAGVVVGMVAAVVHELERHDALTAELDRLQHHAAALAARPPPPVPSPPPRAAPEPDAWNPVTSRPKHVDFRWCFRFHWRTSPTEQERLVPSRSSRSQYSRIAKVIYVNWGRELDKRKTTFEVLRWIGAPQNFEERQERYMRVMQGERPSERPVQLTRSWKAAVLPKRLLRAPRQVRVGETTDACDPGSLIECRSPPAPLRCLRPGRRRWEPRRPVVCGEGAPLDPACLYTLETQMQETMGRDFRLPRLADRVPTPDSTGSCLPHLAPCPRRRRRRPAGGLKT